MVSAITLDHKIPCLGLSVKERFHVNIIKEGLKSLGLEPGPWLSKFKQALYDRADPVALFEVKRPGQKSPNRYELGKLADQNEKIVAFAKDSDHLFIEAVFLDKDRELAGEKYHLTARQAGELAARAAAKQFSIFHFSPRYTDQESLLYQEANEAYNNFK